MKNKRTLLLILIIILIPRLGLAGLVLEGNYSSYLIGDYETGQVLEGENIDQDLAIASISKIMTYIVAMDHVKKGQVSLDDMVLIEQKTARIGGSSMDLLWGERVSLYDLLVGSMVVSANDATYAISVHVASSEEDFVHLMNEKAKELGLESAKFYNSTGLPLSGGIQNTMTTRDLFKLANYLIENYSEVLEITSLREFTRPEREFSKENTNSLVASIKEVDGLKTGYTDKAGYCNLITFKKEARGNREDLRLVGIVMGTDGFKERNALSQDLVNYSLGEYDKKRILDKDLGLLIEDTYSKSGDFLAYPKEDFSLILRSGDRTDLEVIRDYKLPIKEGQVLGQVSLKLNGEEVFRTDLVSHEKIKKAGIFRRVFRRIRNFF